MKNSKPQLLILTIGFTSIGLGVWTMLQTPTLILPSWFLVLLFLPIAFIIALTIGFLIKKMSKSSWHTLTFTSILLTILCLSYFISEYRPSYTIEIPKGYVGEVKLLLSKSDENILSINSHGIGYLNEKTYRNGFRPTIIKGGKDITKEITGYGMGTFISTQTGNYKVEYVNFTVPQTGKRTNWDIVDIDDLIKLNAVDTTLLVKK